MKEALEQVLDALTIVRFCVPPAQRPTIERAIETTIEALSQPEQEPVGKVVDCNELGYPIVHFGQALFIGTLLYTTPPQRTWVGLTEEDKHTIEVEAAENDFTDLGVILATEAKLKELNT